MIVLFEFFGPEPIENVITSMHYSIEKVVYFGFDDSIENRSKSAVRFLHQRCGVKTVEIEKLKKNDLPAILDVMRDKIKSEIAKGNEVYFDITGGEYLILVAFGILSRELDTPMHLFDVVSNSIIEIDEGSSRSMSLNVPKNDIRFDLDSYIELKGGVINYKLDKALKEDESEETAGEIAKIWNVSNRYPETWTLFSDFMKAHLSPDSELRVRKSAREISDALYENGKVFNTPKKLNAILDELAFAGLLLDLVHAEGRYSFAFKNRNIKDCIWDGGSILELHVFEEERKQSDDCLVGVHLDWDGVIHPERGKDVLNEIDVLTLNGNIPTFISCKTGKMDANKTLHAFYELSTVSKRFGGKYSKRVLVCTQNVSDIYLERANEMDIEVRIIK